MKAVTGLFKDSKVTISGNGSMKDVTITGKDLDGQQVLQTMQDKGFTGTIQAMKK